MCAFIGILSCTLKCVSKRYFMDKTSSVNLPHRGFYVFSQILFTNLLGCIRINNLTSTISIILCRIKYCNGTDRRAFCYLVLFPFLGCVLHWLKKIIFFFFYYLAYFSYHLVYFYYYSLVLLHFLILFINLTVLFQLVFSFIYNTFSKKNSISTK